MSNIESLGNLKPTADLSMLEMSIIIIIWTSSYKIEVFTIGSGSELLIKIGLIMKKIMKKSMFGRKGNGVQEV